MCAESRGRSPKSTPHLTVLSAYFKPETLTPWEETVRRRTVAALRKLTQRIEDSRSRREGLLEDTWQLLKEKSHVQAENRFFVNHLSKENEQYAKKLEELRKRCVHECGELEQRRQELGSRFTQRDADLQAQLMQGRLVQRDLKQQLQALQPISAVKERQDMKIRTLEQEKEKLPGQTAARDQEARFQFLQEKAFLEKELEGLRRVEMGDTSTKELKRQTKALSLAAKQAHVEFCHGLNRENQQLRKELQQLSQEGWKLEATRSQLEKQLQRLKEEQWYLEALLRGRQRLQAERERGRCQCPKDQHAPEGVLSSRCQNQE